MVYPTQAVVRYVTKYCTQAPCTGYPANCHATERITKMDGSEQKQGPMSFRAKLREAANAAPHPTGKDALRVQGLVQCLLNAHTWSINLGRCTGLFLCLDEATLGHFAPFIQSCMKPSPFDQLSYVLPGASIPPELASGQYAPITIHKAQGINSSLLLSSYPVNGSFRLWKKVDLNTQLTCPPINEGAHDELIRALRTNVGAGTGEELRRLISRYEVISGNLGHQTSVAVQSSQAERAEVAKGTGLHQLLRVHKQALRARDMQALRARDMSRYEITQAILGSHAQYCTGYSVTRYVTKAIGGTHFHEKYS